MGVGAVGVSLDCHVVHRKVISRYVVQANRAAQASVSRRL